MADLLGWYLASIFVYLLSFSSFRNYLAIKNTPTSKAIAVSPGVCEVYGEAETEDPFILFDGTKCISYALRIGNKMSYNEKGFCPFYIKDETGKILIDPSAAAEHDFSCLHSKMEYITIYKDYVHYPEAMEFLKKRGLDHLAKSKLTVRFDYTPVGTKVHVIGDYSIGPIRKPKLPEKEPQAGLSRFYHGLWRDTKILYKKQLPQEPLPHIGLGKNKVFHISGKDEKWALGQITITLLLSLLLAPLIIAVFTPPVVGGILDRLLGAFPEASINNPQFMALTYILIMIYPAYLYLSSFYNSLVILRNNASKYLSNIEVYLDRRARLIPQLKKIVEGHAKHEKKLLEKIAGRNLTEKEFFAVAEKMPEIKADEHFRKLSKSISEAETQVASFRTLYNDSVTLYNTRIQTFPSILFAGILGFKKLELLEFED